MTPGLSFDQLYVVSDLHLGGDAGFQIFGSTAELVWLIDHLGRSEPGRQLALVINGDFVDFLAESDPRHFDPFGAVAKLDRIAAADPAFAPVFDALRRFVALPSRHLIINLGNHDLELALPWVRRRLADHVAGGAPHRLHLVLDGTGVACNVGGCSVLCVHGNEVDRWNPADFETIRRIARDAQLGRPIDRWVPNAGTQMVIDVMNTVKRRFPFVDLLKPEKEGVVPVLAACDPAQLGSLDRLLSLASVAGSRLAAGVFKPDGMLGEADPPPISATPPAATLLAGTFARRDPGRVGDALMQSVEAAARRDVDPMDLVQGREAEQLGKLGALWKWLTEQPTEEVLREALEKLDQDRSFDLRDYDATAAALDAEVSPAVDFLVAGHTHLERALPRRHGGGVYLNSGTWARLIRIAPDVRRDPARFAALFAKLKDGSMATLDAQPGLIERPNTVVAVRAAAGGGATAELLHVARDATGPGLKPVTGSHFARPDR